MSEQQILREAVAHGEAIEELRGNPMLVVELRSSLSSLEAENLRYREKYGCLDCGEVHHGECCPPVETRTTGKAWFGTTQAINRYHALEAENAKLRRVVVAYLAKEELEDQAKPEWVNADPTPQECTEWVENMDVAEAELQVAILDSGMVIPVKWGDIRLALAGKEE